jgi:16S rRNA (cytosine1402-N4)-methyltransferase
VARERFGDHIPVLLDEVRSEAGVRQDEVWVDCTLGFGGHTEQLLIDGAIVIGIDQDPETLQKTQHRLSAFSSRLHCVEGNFRNLPELLSKAGYSKVDGILADLGVSSKQLDEAGRGFSFSKVGPIDMRMSSTGETAEELIERIDTKTLARIIRRYGEERFAFPIARAIHQWFKIKDERTTVELAQIIAQALPAKIRRTRNHHPATKTFQALRIQVNDELGALERLLEVAPDHLTGGGRLLIISFHSLEDRMVKKRFKILGGHQMPARGSAVPLPITAVPSAKIRTPKPIIARARENQENPRSRSAKLRVLELLGAAA